MEHGAAHHDGHTGASWAMAVKATLHCLTGCAIRELLGMVVGTALMWGNAPTVSIAVMEIVDNAIVALTPGALDAHLSDGLFWSALLGGFAVAFVITTPVNKWMIGRGKGHAVVHAHR